MGVAMCVRSTDPAVSVFGGFGHVFNGRASFPTIGINGNKTATYTSVALHRFPTSQCPCLVPTGSAQESLAFDDRITLCYVLSRSVKITCAFDKVDGYVDAGSFNVVVRVPGGLLP